MNKIDQIIEIDNIEMEHIPSMIDFLQSGLEICFMSAVDFTGSNGIPTAKDSLHYFNNKSASIYEQSLSTVGEILLEYDEDKKVPLYGFGA